MEAVTITELMTMWENDAKIDRSELAAELEKIPQLHSKYLNILVYHTLILKKLENEYKVLTKDKWDYFTNAMPVDEQERRGYERIDKSILRQDIDKWMGADKEVADLVLKKAVHENIVEFCKYVIKEINSRSYTIRSMIDWEKFRSGG